ncbi:hypothetical protein [Caulobacter sp. UNC358MFTsu5.1]|uniref:hypothetical protein n=1 Tax=Caulobacter sp. UNC358MFTsu5.1 TaxID=1449049 RepID=UPI0004A7480A|nr:hypothetical protein [Caulobacter sp. UNC358MFTsu5.1]
MRSLIVYPLLLTLTACASAPTPAPAGAARRGDPAALLANADADRDGRVTLAEFHDARVRLFDRLDRNGDGFVSGEDAPRRRARRAPGGGRLAELTAGLDRNGDGRVARAEFVDGPSRLFDRADANGDKVVDAAELNSLRAALAAMRRP